MIGVLQSLIAAIIGALTVRIFTWFRLRRCAWFWAPQQFHKVTVVLGSLKNVKNEFNEVEPVITFQRALALFELKRLLGPYYTDIAVVAYAREIDWKCPVICLGGPLANEATNTLGQAPARDEFPLWFIDLHRYTKPGSYRRGIGDQGSQEQYYCKLDSAGQISFDVAIATRLYLKDKPNIPFFAVAGCYGPGTYGAIRFLSDPAKLSSLRQLKARPNFQIVFGITIEKEQVVDVRVITHRSW